MLVALGAGKGSPGATTCALAVAAAASNALGRDGALLVEADPSGGDLECWCGPLGEAGLMSAATDIRFLSDSGRLQELVVEVVRGVDAIAAPTADAVASATLRSTPPDFGATLAAGDRVVVADIGRIASSGVHADVLLQAADLAVVVCRPTLASIEHSRGLVAALSAFVPTAVVVVGTGPYGVDEIARALGVDAAWSLPWDSRGVATLVERGVGRAWLRSSLGVASRHLFGTLYEQIGPAREMSRG